jgi:uncharacterized protein with GYD domain
MLHSHVTWKSIVTTDGTAHLLAARPGSGAPLWTGESAMTRPPRPGRPARPRRPGRRLIVQTYVLMTRLGSSSLRDADARRGKGKEWLDRVHKACPEVKWVAHYALLGPYDFIDIYEAPDDATAHKISLISRSEGADSAESWPAMPWDQHLRLLEDVQK